MKKTEYTMFNDERFLEIYKSLNEDKSLVKVLVEMQTQTGISEKEAHKTANTVMAEVTKFEYTKDLLTEDANAVVEDFLRGATKLQGYDRKLILHEMDFGFDLYHNPELMKELKNGATIDTLFRTYYAKHGEDPALTEAVLEQNIREKLSRFHVGSEALRQMMKSLEKSNNVVYTAAALGEDGLRFKSIVAMDQYLHNRDVETVEAAVQIACTHVEVKAVADAVNHGQMTAETAKKILRAVCLTALIVGAVAVLGQYMLPVALKVLLADARWSALNTAFGVVTTASEGLTLMELGVGTGIVALQKKLELVGTRLLLGGLGIHGLTNDIGDLIGRVSAKRFFFRQEVQTGASHGLEMVAELTEAEDKLAENQDWEQTTQTARNVQQSHTAIVF